MHAGAFRGVLVGQSHGDKATAGNTPQLVLTQQQWTAADCAQQMALDLSVKVTSALVGVIINLAAV